jgi:hypothetical protein
MFKYLIYSIFDKLCNVDTEHVVTALRDTGSYSFRHVDYRMYCLLNANLSKGYEQSWFSVVLSNKGSAILIARGDKYCFYITESLFAGGSDNEFIIESNAQPNCVASKSLMPESSKRFRLRRSIHAFISKSWSPPQQNMLISCPEDTKPIKIIFNEIHESDFFGECLNPNTRDLKHELLKAEEASLLFAEIYTMKGVFYCQKRTKHSTS